jgi:putative membrane protein
MADYMGWMMFGSYVFWIVLVALGLFVVVRLTRAAESRGGGAKAILDERLARGEIDAEEYRSRLAVLKV